MQLLLITINRERDTMKLIKSLFCVILILILTGCHTNFSQKSTVVSKETQKSLEAITEKTLTDKKAELLSVEVSEDTQAMISYTYSTEGKEPMILSYAADGQSIDSFTLASATEEAYDSIWHEEKVSLKQGQNTFYLSGDQITCKMQFKLEDLEKGEILSSEFP